MNSEPVINKSIKIVEPDVFEKHISGIIDAAILLSVVIGSFFLIPVLKSAKSDSYIVIPWYFILAMLIVYRLAGFIFFNKTIGMRICNIKILNADKENLTLKEKIFASFFILINGVAFHKNSQNA